MPIDAAPTGAPQRGSLPYRPCVGIMLFNGAGEVFVGRRRDTPDAWQMPQGGIDDGEDVTSAALRELEEEIGTRDVTLLAETDDWLSYDFPEAILRRNPYRGNFRGQRQKWVAARLNGGDDAIDVATPEPEFDAWRWVSLDRLIDLIVPFKRDTYRQVVAAFAHLA